MKRGEMLTGRSVSADCGLRIAECGFQAAWRRYWVGRLVFGIALLCLLAGLLAAFRFGFGASAATGIGGQDKSADGVWQRTPTVTGEWAGRSGVPESAVVFKLDESALRQTLRGTEGEIERQRDGGTEGKSIEMWLPMPDGEFARFRVVEAPVMKPELAAQLPEIKSYRGWGIDDGGLTMRCDLSPLGFHAMVTDGAELIAIHSVEKNDREHYVSYAERDYAAVAASALCLVNESKVVHKITPSFSRNSSIGNQIRQYDVAIATTVEYTTANGGQSATMLNLASRVGDLNLIFERELSIRLNLVTNSSIVYTISNDPFTNGTLETVGQTPGMVDQVRSVLNSQIGPANYDFGLVLGTGASAGSAYVGVVCETASDVYGPYKGGGAVLVDSSVSIQTNVAMMAHEIGHQFGATHTQNANCGVRIGDTAWESGGGLTLMSNAGNCAGNDFAAGRSANFHSGSFEQIIGYLSFQGAACATLASNGGNVPPTVTLLNNRDNYVIPKQTPFALTATATDTPGETLTYSWEQVDAGNSFASPPNDDAGDQPLTTRPIFRPFDPATNGGVRTFPMLSGILNGLNSAQFEFLPNINRHLNFRVTARDQRGGVTNSSLQLTVDQSAGPFTVTSPNSNVAWLGNRQQTITWDKAGTDGGQVLCANVRISLSTDGGITFPIVLAANTPNDGSEAVTIPPNVGSGTSRIKVEAANNIFFDISNTNFALTSCPVITVDPVTLPNGFVGTSYSSPNIIASGGAAPYTYSVNAGALPSGVMLSAGGVFSGTPTTVGVYNFTVLATANNGCQGSRAYSVIVSGDGLMFYPLSTPVKLLDTRGQSACFTNSNTPIGAGGTLTQVARGVCGIASNAQAVTGNVTVYTPPANGYLTLYPSDAMQPLVANINYQTSTLGNVFTVGLGVSDGAFKIFAVQMMNIEIDITGYFAPPGANAMYFHPLPVPVRLLDTRVGVSGCTTPGASLPAGSETFQQGNNTCGIPSTALALVGNATTVGPAVAGNLVLFRGDVARPSITSGNYSQGQTLNSPFHVALSPSGQFKIYTTAQTNLVIDVLGYYSPDAIDATSGIGLLYSSLTPTRLLDTRAGSSGCYVLGAPLQAPNEYLQPARGVCTIATTAKSVIGNATVVTPATNGFLTLWPSDASRPLVATSNYVAGVTFNRFFTVGMGTDGAFKMFVSATSAHLVIDVSGYFAP